MATGRRSISRGEALSVLAERLYFVLEKLDPLSELEWCDLPDASKAFYGEAVESLFEESRAVHAIIERCPKTA